MNETVKQLMATYDTVPYVGYAYPHAHPDRLAVVAGLAGVAAQDVEDCRVLEIGCAIGGNLIPMAEQLPRSKFLGIDLSRGQIDAGRGVIRELGLTNIELRCQDLMEFPEDAGQFDYIIAHGVYSWVPAVVRERLLQICRRHLAPRGVAYISYNTYPGWRVKEMARDMMLYRARGASDLRERVALGRQVVKLVAEYAPSKALHSELLRFLGSVVGGSPDESVAHDYMEVVNEPQYFWRFVEEAGGSGLKYIGESIGEQDPWVVMPGPVRETVLKISQDSVDREQYLDHLVGRSFRGSVLCLAETATGASSSPAGAMRGLYVAGKPAEMPAGAALQTPAICKFADGSGAISIDDPAWVAGLGHLCRAWPMAVPFQELASVCAQKRAASISLEKTTEDLERVITTLHGLRLVELWSRPTSTIALASETHPRATRYARWQAARNVPVISLRHTRIVLDRGIQSLMQLLDGSRDRQSLVAEMVRQNAITVSPHQMEEVVRSALRTLADSSLLVRGS